MSKCDSKTGFLVFPHAETVKNDLGIEKAAHEPWTLIVCPGCYANEVIPLTFGEETPARVKFPKQMYERLHGYSRKVSRLDGTGKTDIEFVESTWASRPCLSIPEAKLKVESKQGIPLTDAFEMNDEPFTPKEQEAVA